MCDCKVWEADCLRQKKYCQRHQCAKWQCCDLLEVGSENFEPKIELLLAVQRGSRRGSSRSSLIGFMGVSPKTCYWRRR